MHEIRLLSIKVFGWVDGKIKVETPIPPGCIDLSWLSSCARMKSYAREAVFAGQFLPLGRRAPPRQAAGSHLKISWPPVCQRVLLQRLQRCLALASAATAEQRAQHPI